MNKYSIQNECLESIEAFSDKQIESEMAVFESVMDVFEKTILMMELANSDIDLPNCAIFTESMLIQEMDPADPNQPTDGQAAPAGGEQQQQQQQQATKSAPTEAERKAYNSENQFRQMNKKGETENIFVSIILFIPRLLGFLIQCVVKLFKKITNKENDKAVANTANQLANLSQEEIDEIGREVNEGEGQPLFNTQTRKWGWFDETKVIQSISEASKALEGFNVLSSQEFTNAINALAQAQTTLGAALEARVEVDGAQMVTSKNTLLQHMKGLSDKAEQSKETIKNVVENRKFDKGDAKLARDLCNKLKDYEAKFFTGKFFKSSVANTIIKAYEKALKVAKNLEAKNQQQGDQTAQNNGQPQTPQQGGGVNNGQPQGQGQAPANNNGQQ
jgi:hypothetical protein